MKNLVILHLESISRQRLAAFAAVMPHTVRLISEALVFDNFCSSATSTRMVVGYLFHGNDFEYDTAISFESMKLEGNNPHLFATLRDHGYNADMICLNGYHHRSRLKIRSWSDALPPAWQTGDFPALIARFDELTDAAPFAIYVWDLITHIEHSLAVAPYSSGLTDQVRRACAVADDAVGQMRAILERKALLDETTIVLYGDHGDDPWTHGFKGGMVHGTEPYTDVIWSPLAIRDSTLAPATVASMASTIDIAPTCLSLLGVDAPLPFHHSGVDLRRASSRLAYAQNLTANQASGPFGVPKAFSATDETYTLLVKGRGLEMYAHRLDPGNHCNVLHFFTLSGAGELVLDAQDNVAQHFRSSWHDNPRAVEHLAADFARLRNALAAHVAAKRAYVVERAEPPHHTLDPASLDVINQDGRDAFFGRMRGTEAHAAVTALEFSYKLR